MHTRSSWRAALLLGAALLFFGVRGAAPVQVAPADAAPLAWSVDESVPAGADDDAPLSRAEPARPGIAGRVVQCRRVCQYRVLRRGSVVLSRTPTSCRLECPGRPTTSCSTSQCR